MNEMDIILGLGQADDRFIAEAAATIGKAKKASRPRLRRRWKAVLAAAVICLLLMGAGAAAGVYGNSIQSWFGHYWELLTGNSMSEGQAAVIDRLSQVIGLSESCGGVTVTVDSAASGDDSFFILLRVSGASFSKNSSYGFEEAELIVSPDPMQDSGGIAGYGIEFQGIDGDGAALLLLSYDYTLDEGYVEDTRPLEVKLRLKGFAENVNSDRKRLLADGEWSYEFVVERNRVEVIYLPDTEIMVPDISQDEYIESPVTLTDIELTNTGIRFRYDSRGGTLSAEAAHAWLVLSDGQEVFLGSKSGIMQDDGSMYSTGKWLVPVDLAEVSALRFGDVTVPIE